MKKAIVPICIVLFILIVVIVNSFGNEPRRPRSQSSGSPQPSRLVGDYSPSEGDTSNDGNGNDGGEMITIIGSPDTSESKPSSNVDTTDPLLVKSSKVHPEQILHRIAYTTSYNNVTKNANWVAWILTREHTDGPYPRKGVPYYDDKGNAYGIGPVTQETVRNGYFMDMESEKPRQELYEWSSQYNMSHGHLCPAGDNKWDKAAMNQSFLLTNMCPQDASLNGGAWKKLEEKCRTWANIYGNIYIVAGPIFYGSPSRFLGHIAIPDAFFKVILRFSDEPKAIGFIYRNDSSSQSMKEACRTIHQVEEITGFDFFHNLPDDIEDKIEKISNLKEW